MKYNKDSYFHPEWGGDTHCYLNRVAVFCSLLAVATESSLICTCTSSGASLEMQNANY